ncbi:MAG: hypothetical protein H6719_09650 [Sandaracinaceae bacterium]|nr:hypothetical protein [Sandaracinaceae bacterium]
MTTTSTSDTRLYFEVPSPFTSLAIGKFRADNDTSGVDYAGISVNADDHVRLYAKGSPGASDAILQSYGQAWLQAKNRMSGTAAGGVMIGSRGRTLVGSSDGINILAGFETVPPSSEGTPGTLPAMIEKYEPKATIASSLWTGFDVSMGITAGVVGIVQAVVGTGFSWVGATHVAANLVGAALGIATLGWSREVSMLPGINLFSQGGTYMGALYGSVNITGMVGLTMGSLFHTKLAIGMSRLRGYRRASVSAAGTVDFSGLLWYECKSDGEQTIASRAGTLTMRGAAMTLGQLVAVFPQSPTSVIEVNAINEVAIECPLSIQMSALTKLESTAMLDTYMKCLSSAKLHTTGDVAISINNSEASLSGPGGGSHLTADSCGATLQAVTSTFVAKKEGTILIGGPLGGGKVEVTPGASVTVSGTTVDIG